MGAEAFKLISIFIAILIILGLFLVLLFLIFLKRKNNLIKQNFEQKLSNQKRQHELELKALRGQMNPHFVHNSLNAIQFYIQQNDVETSEVYLAKFSKLMRQFFDYSRRKRISISDEIEILKNYLQIEILRFEEKFDFNFNIDSKLDINEHFLPSMLLQPLVENAINHGIFHRKGNDGKVQISFDYINDYSFKATIIDNGIGINNSKKIKTLKVNDKCEHSSAVFEERIHFLNESSQFKIDYSIIDLSDKNNQTGTEVSIIFGQKIDE